MKDVYLVQMPFSPLFQPSLAIGLLKADARDAGLSCAVEYANLRFARAIGLWGYEILHNFTILHLVGEAVFSQCAGFESFDDFCGYFSWLEKYCDKYEKKNNKLKYIKEIFYSAKARSGAFIADLAEYLLDQKPKIIGCSSLFQQNNASFALMKKIKETDSSVITILGGAQCALQMGNAISRHIGFVDYVFSGEADQSFGCLCRKLIDGEPFDALPYGIITKDRFGEGEVPYAVTCSLDALPIADYDDYFDAVGRYGLEKAIRPSILIEGSRGCWWGEKKPCIFCGLGSGSRKYRVKSTKRLLDEMEFLSERYGIKRFTFTDSILSNEHVKELTRELIAQNRGYSMFCEIKSNLSREDVKNLRDAGFTHIQPGIESLQDDILSLMHKGNTAIKHIEFLKNCRTYGIKLAWNLLVGFPGEKPEWLEELIAIIPMIAHLQMPSGHNHIIYHKFSEYQINPGAYGLDLTPMDVYYHVYPGSEELVADIAYNFKPADNGAEAAYYNLLKKGDVYERLTNAYFNWNDEFSRDRCRLMMYKYSDRIEIEDTRRIAKDKYHTLYGIEMNIYEDCGTIRRKRELYDKYKASYCEDEIQRVIDGFRQRYLIYCSGDKILALATPYTHYKYESEKTPFGNIKATELKKSGKLAARG